MRDNYLTEEDTKVRYITPALRKSGWSMNYLLMEYSLKADRYKIVPGENRAEKVKASKRNNPDYILCRYTNMPLAVLEAKRLGMSDSEGIDQAKTYAQTLDLPFAYSSSGTGFIEYDFSTGTQRALTLDQFPSPDELWDRWCYARGVNNETTRAIVEKARYRTTSDGKVPRYYQMLAINKTVNAVLINKRKRLLLVMATGTGKTYTAFQIVWRLLHEAKVIKNVLFLADRNQLVDQALIGDFGPFESICTKITKRTISKSHQIYFGLYQQLKGNEEDGTSESIADVYKQVPPDFFDLIIIDECHRGSAREQSSWREILEYFDSAIQIGLTATPNEKDGSNNTDYFGKPIYTYSLKQGIEDGYLAPYQVKRVMFDKDVDGWEPQDDERDLNGHIIPKRKYTLNDFDSKIILKSRTREVARIVSKYLKELGPMSKTIIFCTTQRHALEMRDALRELNADMMQKNHNYIVRMTADDPEGKALYDDFTSAKEPYPVIVTTSKLLTTGADTKCVKLIVLDAQIPSKTEFKQIIGRGTRLREDMGKTFFTILDFRGTTLNLHDPEFDGAPDYVSEWDEDQENDPKITKHNRERKQKEDTEKKERNPIYVVDNVDINVVGESTSYLDEEGKVVTEKFRVYTRNSILELFGSEAEFVDIWNNEAQKHVIIDKLEQKGILMDQLKKDAGNSQLDEFDLIMSIAFGSTPLTRDDRANRVKQGKFLEQYHQPAREVLEALLDIYHDNGVCELDSRKVLQNARFNDFGGIKNIMGRFGSISEYDHAVRSMVKELYKPSSYPKRRINVDSMIGL